MAISPTEFFKVSSNIPMRKSKANINNNTMNNNYNNYNNINEINETFYDEPIKHESKNEYFKKYEMFKLFFCVILLLVIFI